MLRRLFLGVGAGLIVGILIVRLAGLARGGERPHAARRRGRVGAAAADPRSTTRRAPIRALPVWRQLFAVLPAAMDVDVEVAQAADFDRLLARLRSAGTPHLGRLHRVVVGAPITTWSRDRYAALVDDRGGGSILAPPRIETPFPQRAGDMRSPSAISRALYGGEPRISEIVFEGGDLAATPRWVFADANLAGLQPRPGRGGGPRLDRARARHHLGQSSCGSATPSATCRATTS